MVLIRTATEKDAEAISHVHVESWRTTYAGIVPASYLDGLNQAERVPVWREWLSLELHPNVLVFVAVEDGEVVGFIGGGPIREPVLSYDAELFAIYLLKRSQGKGTGTALLKALASSLAGRGFMSMAVWALESGSSSRFYAKSGAVPIASKAIEIGGATLPVGA